MDIYQRSSAGYFGQSEVLSQVFIVMYPSFLHALLNVWKQTNSSSIRTLQNIRSEKKRALSWPGPQQPEGPAAKQINNSYIFLKMYFLMTALFLKNRCGSLDFSVKWYKEKNIV